MQQEPEGPYVYQLFGMQDKAQWATRRVYAIGGLPIETTVIGLTKDEANKVLVALVGVENAKR